MARKTHTKKERTREEYMVARHVGAPVLRETSNGKVLLNIWKHFCYHKPYKNEEYEAIMFAEIKRRKDAYENSRKGATVNA